MIHLTKERIYDMGETACVTNALIDFLNSPTQKLDEVEFSKINNTLTSLQLGFKPTVDLGEQWCNLIDMIESMNLSEKELKEITEEANIKLRFLMNHSKLT